MHLELQAAALLETADGVRLPPGKRVAYDVDGRIVTPYVVRGEPVFPHFIVRGTAPAIFEYWMIVSEILASSAWSVTKVIADAGEYDDALRRMQQPQIVKALVAAFLPSAELRDDGTARLDVTVYTRAGEERVERRALIMSDQQEFVFHGRELIAEGSAGVAV